MEKRFLVDTHAHLDMISKNEDQLASVIQRASEHGVKAIITVAIDESSTFKALNIAKRFPSCFSTVGLHPNDAQKYSPNILEKFENLALNNKEIVAVGEIGLDFYRDYTPRKKQYEAFCAQLEIASRLGLPVIIHARDALKECISIIKDFIMKNELKGVFHCFSGDKNMAQKVLDLGFYISFTGVLTFPKADGLRKVASYIPIEHILIETDCPFLSPVPFRGKPNEPARVYYVADVLAKIKHLSLDEVAECTTKSAKDLFKLPIH